MESQIEIQNIIAGACLKHSDSGEASFDMEARRILQALEDNNYKVVKESVKPDLNKASEAFSKALENITPEDIEKYFPPDNTPKGWVSIEDHLPAVTCDDLLNHGAMVRIVRVKDKDGNEGKSQVGDHHMWYYGAKDAGITHWWNGEETAKQKTFDALYSTRKITIELLEKLEKEHGIQFDVVSIPRFSFPPINDERIRLFKFDDKIFL